MQLNEEAWTRWIAYRSAIKKPLKDISIEAAKLKLSRMGDEETQAKIIDQSIAQQWQGLFALKEAKDPTAPKKRTKEEEAVASASFQWAERRAVQRADEEAQTVRGRLRILSDLLARYECEGGPLLSERVDAIRGKVVDILGSAVRGDVKDPRVVTLIYAVLGRDGVQRLYDAKIISVRL